MLLAVLLTGLIATLTWNNDFLQATAAEPGYLDFDNLPETNFSCEGKVIGGYYADVETGCQMFHVCTIGQKDIKFLCLNGTVFDQETRVCERLDEVDCSKSESYYDLNLELYGNSGATYGIQPENEEEPPASNGNDEDKCLEDEEDCKTEPQDPLLNKPADLEDEYEELEEAVDPTTSSTTTTTTTTTQRPTRPPSTTSPRPAQVPYPTSSPETIAALLALHNAFQESLKEHERPPPPRVSNSFPSPTPVKSPPPPPRFSSPVSFSTSPRPLSFAQNFPGGNHHPSLPQQPQVSNHHFPAPQSHKQPLPQPFPFNITPKPKQPAPAFSSTLRTSQAFGNSNFQQSFREEQQQQKLQPQEEDEEYSVEDYDLTQPSSQRPLYNAYKHNQNRFAISHQDTNPNAAPSNFLLHQLKLRFNDNLPQKHPGAHGFTRAVSNHDTKILTYPEKPIPVSLIASSTTPAAVSVILSKTSTTSVVRSVSSRNQSAISHAHPPVHYNTSKFFPTSTLKPSSTTVANISQPLEEDYKTEEEYDYYQEELGPDPFYKDVPKLERQRRSLQNETDLIRLKKKYVILLQYLKKYKHIQNPEKQVFVKEKIRMLKEKLKAAEAQVYQQGNNSGIGINTLPDMFISLTNTEITTEEGIVNTFPTMEPPTPPAFRYLSQEFPELKHSKNYEFTLLANNSYVYPYVTSTATSTLAQTESSVPFSYVTSRKTTKVPSTDVTSRTTTKVPLTEVTSRTTTKVPLTDVTSRTTTKVPLTDVTSRKTTKVPLTDVTSRTTTKVPLTDVTSRKTTKVPLTHVTSRTTTKVPLTHVTSRKTTKVPLPDLVDIPEDGLIPRVTPKWKHIREDYFGSISSSRTESIRELLQRIKSKSFPKRKPNGDETLWFSSNDTSILLGGSFSESLCTGKDFYNEFVVSNETDASLTDSSPTLLLVGTRYIKLCSQCVMQRIMLVFFIETRYLMDTVQYRQIKKGSTGISLHQLVDIIELKSRIKVLQFKRNDNTFKVVREMSTSTNPRFVVENIVERMEATGSFYEQGKIENH